MGVRLGSGVGGALAASSRTQCRFDPYSISNPPCHLIGTVQFLLDYFGGLLNKILHFLRAHVLLTGEAPCGLRVNLHSGKKLHG